MEYVTIDFEASCLPRQGRSFPVEVGICGSEGAESWLIAPAPSWRTWDWTEEAIRLHGITPQMLADEGLPPAQVFAELRRRTAGRTLVADSPVDSYWWETLAFAAGCIHPSPIRHVGSILDGFQATTGDILAAQCRADALIPGRHRAREDASWLWALLSGLERRAIERAVPTSDTPARLLPALSQAWTSELAA